MQSFRIELQKNCQRIERVGISEIKFEAAQIHLLSDVFVVFPSSLRKLPIIVDATSGTYNALRVTPPTKLQNQCCCLPHICIALHLTDEHSVLLKSGLFLSLIGLDLDPL